MAVQIVSFILMFAAGCIGAGVFLLMLLLTVKDLEILKNNIISNLKLMAVLYISAGGVVALITQISTGNPFEINHLQALFMLGFGWQGVISGFGAAGYAKNKGVEYNEKRMIIEKIVERKDEERERALEYLQDRLSGFEKKLGKR